MADKNEIGEAVETIADAASDAVATEAALEAAQEAQEEAEEMAEEIAAAAMEAERMRRIEAHEQETAQWRNELNGRMENLSQQMASLTTQLTEALTALASPPAVTVQTQPAPETSSILPPSPEAAPPQTTVTIDPVGAAALPAPEPAPAKQKRVRFL